MNVLIRTEREKDFKKIRKINRITFGRDAEGEIVESVRENCTTFLSLVAEVDGKILGHILFSPAYVRVEHKIIGGMGLGPMSVHPDHQKKGIGWQLVKEGLKQLETSGYPFVIVLGLPEYYPKFGFERASKFNLHCQWDDVPDEAFMAIIYNHEKMAEVDAVAYYRTEFDDVMAASG